MRKFKSALLATTLVTTTIGAASAVYASGWRRYPSSFCATNSTYSTYNVNSYDQVVASPTLILECPVIDDDAHPENTISSAWADFNFGSNNNSANVYACYEYYTGGSPGGVCTGAATASGTGFQSVNFSSLSTLYGSRSYDYPYLSINMAAGTFQGYGVGY